VKTFLVRTILKVVDMSDQELRSEFLRLRREKKAGRISDEDFTLFTLIEGEKEIRKKEK